MTTRKATVRAGQLVLAEPLDLPDGAEVSLIVDDGDEMPEAERVALEQALAESEADIRAGRVYSGEEVLAGLQQARTRPATVNALRLTHSFVGGFLTPTLP